MSQSDKNIEAHRIEKAVSDYLHAMVELDPQKLLDSVSPRFVKYNRDSMLMNPLLLIHTTTTTEDISKMSDLEFVEFSLNYYFGKNPYSSLLKLLLTTIKYSVVSVKKDFDNRLIAEVRIEIKGLETISKMMGMYDHVKDLLYRTVPFPLTEVNGEYKIDSCDISLSIMN